MVRQGDSGKSIAQGRWDGGMSIARADGGQSETAVASTHEQVPRLCVLARVCRYAKPHKMMSGSNSNGFQLCRRRHARRILHDPGSRRCHSGRFDESLHEGGGHSELRRLPGAGQHLHGRPAGRLQHHGGDEPSHRGCSGAADVEQRPKLERRAHLQFGSGHQRAPEPFGGGWPHRALTATRRIPASCGRMIWAAGARYFPNTTGRGRRRHVQLGPDPVHARGHRGCCARPRSPANPSWATAAPCNSAATVGARASRTGATP